MNKKLLQWLLSLSLLSLLGPKCDIDFLSSKGFFKKNSEIPELLLNISYNESVFVKYKTEIQSFLDLMNVSDKDSFKIKMEELVQGTLFSKNMDKMMLLGKMMTKEERENRDAIIVNKHHYNKAFFNEVLLYEFRWPKEGLYAYDLANGVMLLRLGVELGYIIEEDQYDYLNTFKDKYYDQFTSYEGFGRDVMIGRNLHISHLKSIRSAKVIEDQEQLLSIAYYGMWQYLETSEESSDINESK